MRIPSFSSVVRSAAIGAAAAVCLFGATATPAFAAPIKNIVLVHGAFVVGGGWRPVYDILTKDGYNVTLVQEPLTSFKEDVTATKRVIDGIDGPVVLVGHSYAGQVVRMIGDARPDLTKRLVYLDAFVGDDGQAAIDLLPP
ncbi:MAG TPA: alpha/beta hydrolase, partial [Paraburkholderia sp.]